MPELVISHLQRAFPGFIDPRKNRDVGEGIRAKARINGKSEAEAEIAAEAEKMRAFDNVTSAFKNIGCMGYPTSTDCKSLHERGVTQLQLEGAEKGSKIVGEIIDEETHQAPSLSVARILDGINGVDHSEEGRRINKKYHGKIIEESRKDCPEFHPGRFDAKEVFRGKVISDRVKEAQDSFTDLYIDIDRIVEAVLNDEEKEAAEVAELDQEHGFQFYSEEIQQRFEELFELKLRNSDSLDRLSFTVLGESSNPLIKRVEYNRIDHIEDGRARLDGIRRERAVGLLLFRARLALHARLLDRGHDYNLHQADNGNQAVVKLAESEDRHELADERFCDGLHQAIEAKERRLSGDNASVTIHSEKSYIVKDARSKVGQSTVSILTGHKIDQREGLKSDKCPEESGDFYTNKNKGSWVVKSVEGVSCLEKIKRFMQMIVYAIVWLVFYLVGDRSRADFYWGVLVYFLRKDRLAQREVAFSNLMRLVANPDFKNSKAEMRMHSEYLEDIYIDKNGKKHERYCIVSRHLGSTCAEDEACFDLSFERIKTHIEDYKASHADDGKVLWKDCFEVDGNPAEKFFERRLLGDKDCLKLDNYLWVGKVKPGEEAKVLDSDHKISCCAIDTGLCGHFEGVEFEFADTIEELLEMLLKRTWEHAAQYFGRPTMLDVLALADPKSLYAALYNVLERMAQVKNRQILDALAVVADPHERDRLYRLAHLRKAHAIRLLNTPYDPPTKGCWKRSIEAMKNFCFRWSPTGVQPNMMPGHYVAMCRENVEHVMPEHRLRRAINCKKVVRVYSDDEKEQKRKDALLLMPENTVDAEDVPSNRPVERLWYRGVIRMNSDDEGDEEFVSADEDNGSVAGDGNDVP